ncbi:PQQ-binding-like beta-propeller repeat protein [Draconibacterium sp. IB214405]|uniref:PQQ-binding-like beta-propeller repeat protein n=1 Tax=Draconibacterium sp. IB214405 TaxID=3097352 RepID=UPI002A14CDB3|nr:PQQ-binding-like beta-propeller repeat protein [Draconibacterium sp. IB214405]MDX8340870.1 PQQ-binding-like beta-propeller repeat protein [Draconibacterium sp. IB214405]
MTNFKFLPLILIVSLFFSSVTTTNAQVIQFRGPNRDGIFPETGLLKEWPEEGPEVLWVTEDLGKSNSSTIATADRIYTTGNIDTMEYVSCLDLQGNILWQKSYGRAWINTYPEARCTPTLEDNRLYLLSGLDELVCMNTENGEIIWQVDLHEKYQSDWDMFGVSESPLLVDDKVIASVGGETAMVVALDKMTGELVWKSETMHAKRSNITPLLIEHCGKKYIITANQTHVISVDANTGEIMWDFHHNFLSPNGDNTTILTNVPTYKDSCLWITSGWDVKSSMLKISDDGRSITEKFADQTFDNQNHGVVLVDGYLYGSNFTGRQTGKWVCMNWDTGEIVWIADFHSKGPAISAEGMLYLIDEKRGNVALVKANPKKFDVVSSFKIEYGSGPYWSRPAIYNGMFLVRHGDVLVAYNVKASS